MASKSTSSPQEQFTRLLTALLGNTPDLNTSERFFSGEIDLSPVLRRYHAPSRYVVLLPGQELTDEEVQRDLDTYDPKDIHSLTLIFHAEQQGSLPPNSGGRIYISARELEVLNAIADMKPTVRLKRFALFLAERQQLHQLIPYQNQRAAQGRMFYDRSHDLERLFSAEKYRALIGPRRIGKTSLVLELHRRLAESPTRLVKVTGDPRPVSPSAIISCIDQTPETFWEEAYDQIGVSLRDRAQGRLHALTDPVKRTYRRLNAYESFLKLATHQYKRPFLILDEVDHLIVLDRPLKWPFFKQLKGLADKVAAELVLVGFRDLFLALRDDSFPFFETCDSRMLSVLDQESVVPLVREPLEELGFSVETGVPEAVYSITGGAPAQVQGVCEELLRMAGATRTVSHEFLRQVVSFSPTLRTSYGNFRSVVSGMGALVILLYIRGKFFTLREQLTKEPITSDPTEKMVFELTNSVAALACNEPLRLGWIEEQIARELGEIGEGITWLADVRDALDDLMLRNVLHEVSQYAEYRFVGFYALARLLVETSGDALEREIAQARRRVAGL